MLQQFTAQYFRQDKEDVTSVRTVTLTDTDLVRGNDANESIAIFNGTQELVPGVGFVTVNNGEATTTVFFKDGTAVTGVNALYERVTFKFFDDTQSFLLDTDVLARVGKTLDDVARVQFDGFVDHDLSWADFGFKPTGVIVPDPDPEPEPEPEPALTVVQGTNGADRLTGTAADELIRGGDGNDRLTGRGGEDTFVFGADARDSTRDRDVITDFNPAEDTILFEAGATIRFVEQRGADLFIQLEGDRDTITVLNADRGIVANFVFAEDLFAA